MPSHAPPFEAPTQIVVAVWKPFAGHGAVVPSHVSATSHAPAEARQMSPFARAGLEQPVTGLHVSVVQVFPSLQVSAGIAA